MVLITEYHNSHKHSQSPLTNACILKVLDEVDRTLEEVKHDWLDCLERAVYDKRGWPQPLTAARYNLLSFTGVVSFFVNRKTVRMCKMVKCARNWVLGFGCIVDSFMLD